MRTNSCKKYQQESSARLVIIIFQKKSVFNAENTGSVAWYLFILCKMHVNLYWNMNIGPLINMRVKEGNKSIVSCRLPSYRCLITLADFSFYRDFICLRWAVMWWIILRIHLIYFSYIALHAWHALSWKIVSDLILL